MNGDDGPSAELLGGDELRSRPAERFIADVAAVGVLAHRDGENLDRLRGWVVRALAGPCRRNVPDRRQEVIGNAVRLVWSDPSEEARLVLPGVPGPREDRPVLHPDDLLMHERAELVPGLLDQSLPAARMPTVPGGVGRDSLGYSDTIEVLV